MEKCWGESRRSPRDIQNYLGRISGPLLDRIDLHVEVPQVKFWEISSEQTGEDSAAIRERVVAARQKQQARFAQRTTQPPPPRQVPAESFGRQKSASIAPHTPSRWRTRDGRKSF
jgi:predicted ATPase with chaperone activity